LFDTIVEHHQESYHAETPEHSPTLLVTCISSLKQVPMWSICSKYTGLSWNWSFGSGI